MRLLKANRHFGVGQVPQGLLCGPVMWAIKDSHVHWVSRSPPCNPRRAELHGSAQGESSLAQAEKADVFRRKATFLRFVLSSPKLLPRRSSSHPQVCADGQKLELRLWLCQPLSCLRFLGVLLGLEQHPLSSSSTEDQQGITGQKLEPDQIDG